MYKNKVDFNCFDIAKFVLSLMVIVLHLHPFCENQILDTFISNGICRVAVPLFFMMSGYLLSFKLTFCGDRIKYIKNYLLKLLKLYCIWSLVYFPFILKDLFFNDNSIIYNIFILLKDSIFYTTFSHLWYIKGLIVAIILILILKKLKFSDRKIIIFAFALYIFGMFLDSYYGFVSSFTEQIPFLNSFITFYFDVFSSSRNGIFFGMLFVMLGIYYHKNDKVGNKNNLLLILVCFSLFLIEVFILNYNTVIIDNNMYIFLVPLTCLIFVFISNIKVNFNINFKLLRSLSTLIYFNHLFIYKVLIHFCNINDRLLLFLLVVFFSVLLSYIIIKISDKILFLKKIYM